MPLHAFCCLALYPGRPWLKNMLSFENTPKSPSLLEQSRCEFINWLAISLERVVMSSQHTDTHIERGGRLSNERSQPQWGGEGSLDGFRGRGRVINMLWLSSMKSGSSLLSYYDTLFLNTNLYCFVQ